MQWVTHSLVGAVLQRSAERTIPNKLFRVAAIVTAGALSHVVLDDIARMTYHPRASVVADWTLFLILWFTLVTIVGAIVFWHCRQYWIGMLAAVIPDADWLIFRPLAWVGIAPWWEVGMVHDAIRRIPGLSHFHELSEHFPDLRENLFGIIGEAIIAFMIAWLLIRREPT